MREVCGVGRVGSHVYLCAQRKTMESNGLSSVTEHLLPVVGPTVPVTSAGEEQT